MVGADVNVRLKTTGLRMGRGASRSPLNRDLHSRVRKKRDDALPDGSPLYFFAMTIAREASRPHVFFPLSRMLLMRRTIWP